MASRNRRSPRGWLCFILVVALGRTSEAQTPIPDCGNDTACLALYERASQESKQGNLAEAVRLYKLAYEVRADPKLLFSIARLLHRLDRKQEAILYYRQFIDSPLEYAEQKRKAEQYLEQARQGTGGMVPSPLPKAALQPSPPQTSAEPTPSAQTSARQPAKTPLPTTSQASPEAVTSAQAPASQPTTPTAPTASQSSPELATYAQPPASQPTTPTVPNPSQPGIASTPSVPATAAPEVTTIPQPISQTGAAPTVGREPSPSKRPRWRLIAGGAVIGTGLLLTGFGGSALAAKGKCVDVPIAPAETCDEVFATTPIGGALLGTGAAVVVGGILLMASP